MEDACVHAVWDYRNTGPAKVMMKLRGSMLRNRGKSNMRVAVDAALEESKHAVIQCAMKSSQSGRSGLFVKFREAAKDGVDEDDIGVETIDAGGEYEIEAEAVKKAVPNATKPVQPKPKRKL